MQVSQSLDYYSWYRFGYLEGRVKKYLFESIN